MSQYNVENPYQSYGNFAAEAPVAERSMFIKKTYMHLAAAAYLFVMVEYAIYTIFADQLDGWMDSYFSTRMAHMLLLGGFIAIGYVAQKMARSNSSVAVQYAGLVLYVVAEAIIFVPLIYVAREHTITLAGGTVGILQSAGILTLVMFSILSAVVFISGKDFSFLSTGLRFGMFAAFALILLGFFMGFSLGIWFTGFMIIMACGYILYDTSNVLHHYRTDQPVAASLALFASLALLLWYVIQFFMSQRD